MPEPEPEVTFLGIGAILHLKRWILHLKRWILHLKRWMLGGFVSDAASEAVKMLNQSDQADEAKRLMVERQAAAERAYAAVGNAGLSRATAGGVEDGTGGGGEHRPVRLKRQLSLPRMSGTSTLLRLEVPTEYAALMELEHALPPLLQAFDWSLKVRC